MGLRRAFGPSRYPWNNSCMLDTLGKGALILCRALGRLLALPEAWVPHSLCASVSPNVSSSILKQGLSIRLKSLLAFPPVHPWLWSLVSILHHRAQRDLEAGTQRLTPGYLLAVMDGDERSAVVTAD